jgi:hypothetical protein
LVLTQQRRQSNYLTGAKNREREKNELFVFAFFQILAFNVAHPRQMIVIVAALIQPDSMMTAPWVGLIAPQKSSFIDLFWRYM